ncbi:hypothetical protein BJ994_003486 [Arthrobacter pigmenti]|uniref:Uncharacterized protein n=1 Tax=Arthrobacter pigmenti TaxID=271432 RepID=A0A846RS89_9MICC|nr:hypothetical protein [Arthrobacter pigmenti]NJC24410.1 hypothetical protein [Arthrobacter pigmenti]
MSLSVVGEGPVVSASEGWEPTTHGGLPLAAHTKRPVGWGTDGAL